MNLNLRSKKRRKIEKIRLSEQTNIEALKFTLYSITFAKVFVIDYGKNKFFPKYP